MPVVEQTERQRVAEQFREYQRTGDRRLRNDLVSRYLGIADFYAKRYGQRGVEADDLRQVALLSIVRAVDRFDPDRGIEFSTFASRTVEGEIKRYFRDRTWSVRPPRRTQELHLRVRKAREDLEQHLHRSPTVHELAAAVDDTVDHVIEALEASGAHQATTIEAPADDRPAPAGPEALATSELGFGDVENTVIVDELVAQLSERDRAVIRMRFYEGMTQPEIAAELGVSQSYLSRILRRTLADLRQLLEPAAA